jgi:hypothetical protein
MDNNSQLRPKFVLFFFALQTVLNWLYTLNIKSVAVNSDSSWFVILPILDYFYLAFAIIAFIGLYYRQTLGLILAYCVLMFGTIIAVVSYSFIYRENSVMEFLIIPLIAINLCIIFFMAYSHSFYNHNGTKS